MAEAKQLKLYEKIANPTGRSRSAWRDNTKISRSTYKIEFKRIRVLEGWNIRTIFDGIEELADDIAANGLKEPLEGVLSKDGELFYIVDGERRYRAIKLLNERDIEYDEVEVIPIPALMSVEGMVVRMLSSGVNKSLYKDVEIANCLLRLKEDFELSNEDIAKKIGRSRQYVDNMIKLAKLPIEVKDDIATGKVKKTAVLVPMKDKTTDVVAGMMKPTIQPGLPASLKTDNKEAEKQSSSTGSNDLASQAPAETKVSGKDALQGVNFDKEINEQEGQINAIWKEVNKVEGLAKGLNDQAQKDMDKYLYIIRDNLTKLKEYYGKQKNRMVV